MNDPDLESMTKEERITFLWESTRPDKIVLWNAWYKQQGWRLNLACADLARADLAGANLAGANLADATLAGANLADADLARAYLTGANLAGAYLTGANLAGANLADATLAGANLADADLVGAYLADANLACAWLEGADLAGANLGHANLNGAHLADANLADADLNGARINWSSHTLVSELLLRAAEAHVPRRMLAGLVLVSLDWSWDEFLALDLPETDWALSVLAGWVKHGDGAPEVLRKRKAALDAGESR